MRRRLLVSLLSAMAASTTGKAADFPDYRCMSTETATVSFSGGAWTETLSDAPRVYELLGDGSGEYRVRVRDEYGPRIEFQCGGGVFRYVGNPWCVSFDGVQAFRLDVEELAFTRIDARGTWEQESGLLAVIDTGYCVVQTPDGAG